MIEEDSIRAEVTLWRSLFVATLLGGLGVGCVGLGALVMLGGGNDNRVAAMIMSPIICIIAGTAGLLAVAGMQRGRLVWLSRAALGLTLLTAMYWLAGVWTDGFGGGAVGRLHLRLVLTTSLVAMGLVISVHLLAHDGPLPLLTTARRFASVAANVYLATLIVVLWSDWASQREELVGLVMFGWGAVTLVGLCALSVVSRAMKQRRARSAESIPDRIALRLTCPNCGHDQSLGQGLRRCAKCRCALLIEVEEPRCECGYLLYQLQSRTCPECGRTLSSSSQLEGTSPVSADSPRS
jgi:hypothetical protein